MLSAALLPDLPADTIAARRTEDEVKAKERIQRDAVHGLSTWWLQFTPRVALVELLRHRHAAQQPDTANGTVFVSLEDETGVVQVICWKSLRERQRKVLLGARLLMVKGDVAAGRGRDELDCGDGSTTGRRCSGS